MGGKIWVFEGVCEEEEQSRRTADVFEAEVLRWRTIASAKEAEVHECLELEERDGESLSQSAQAHRACG